MGERKYFGTDGIRGRVGEWPITAEFMLKLGRAAGTVLAAPNRKATVVIGKDTRVSGYMFESALEAGLVAAGADVRLLGPMPTPAQHELGGDRPFADAPADAIGSEVFAIAHVDSAFLSVLASVPEWLRRSQPQPFAEPEM